jgi:L-galactose dehydrogenase/L-glyceraldehyde 3-phosphate reductase
MGRLDDLEGQIRRAIETSLERLRQDRVEVYQLHNPISTMPAAGMISPHDVLRPGGVADIFDRLRQEGLFDAFGFTGLGEAKAIIEVLDSGRFDTVQVYYNMLNPSAGRAMPEGWSGQDFSGVIDACKRHDVGTMAIRVLAAGVLATDERHGREVIVTRDTDLDREQVRARLLFERLGDAHGTRAQTAVRFALTNPELSTLVVGVATLAQLDEALAAIEAGPLPESALAEIAAAYAHGF